jgi:hypothetical protein
VSTEKNGKVEEKMGFSYARNVRFKFLSTNIAIQSVLNIPEFIKVEVQMHVEFKRIL